jgi:hypothetical protein
MKTPGKPDPAIVRYGAHRGRCDDPIVKNKHDRGRATHWLFLDQCSLEHDGWEIMLLVGIAAIHQAQICAMAFSQHAPLRVSVPRGALACKSL